MTTETFEIHNKERKFGDFKTYMTWQFRVKRL